MSVTKIILIWLIVTKKWCAHQCRPLFALSTLVGPKNQNFWKINKIPGDIIILQQCTKNPNQMIFNSQNMMLIALQVILCHLCLLPNFWHKKSKFLKKKKKIPGYITILHLHPKNHNHLIYSSLKMMQTALQVILGQFLPFYSVFGPKSKFTKNEKCLRRMKNTKNLNQITCCSSDRVRTTFLPILGNFCSFTPFLAQKI